MYEAQAHSVIRGCEGYVNQITIPPWTSSVGLYKMYKLVF